MVTRSLFVVCVAALFVVDSTQAPACEIPVGHSDGELVSGRREPRGGYVSDRYT